jgi:hypothetical protein
MLFARKQDGFRDSFHLVAVVSAAQTLAPAKDDASIRGRMSMAHAFRLGVAARAAYSPSSSRCVIPSLASPSTGAEQRQRVPRTNHSA